jgi:hypothetical protein
MVLDGCITSFHICYSDKASERCFGNSPSPTNLVKRVEII